MKTDDAIFSLAVNEHKLEKGDIAKVTDEKRLNLRTQKFSDLLLIDLP